MTQMQVCSLDDALLARFDDNTYSVAFPESELFVDVCYCTLCRYLGSLRTSVYMGRMERCGTAFSLALHQIRCSRAAPKRSTQLGSWYVSMTRLHYSCRGCCLCAVLWLAPPPLPFSLLCTHIWTLMLSHSPYFSLLCHSSTLSLSCTQLTVSLPISLSSSLSHTVCLFRALTLPAVLGGGP